MAKTTMWGLSRSPWRARLGILVMLAVLVAGATASRAQAPRRATLTPADQAVRLYQRILTVGKALLDLERATIFRLEKKRPVEVDRVVAKIVSARRQIGSLRRLARRFEEQIPSADPKRAKVESLRTNFGLVLDAHRKYMQRLRALAGKEILAALDALEHETRAAPASLPATSPYPLRSMDDLF